jgi:hypothetical protein
VHHPSPDLVTYLTDAVEPRPEELGGLRVGHPVLLRPRPDGRTVEAWSPQLGRLGRLPPQEGEALAPLLRTGAVLPTGRVSALVPRPGRSGGTRIHIQVRGMMTET